jgi:hypothetical protein
MKDSFLNSIVSSALSAQDQQYSQDSSSMNEDESSYLSGITEKDGYVGEMVKQTLALFETSSSPKDYRKKFDSKYTVVVESLSVMVSNTSMPTNVEEDSVESIADLAAYVSNAAEIDLDLDKLKVTYGSNNKIHMEQESEYGPIKIEVGVSAYEEVDANTVLKLPRS